MEIGLIENRIFEVRGYKVMLDFHLAEMYELETRVLKQSVRRNINRFPKDFMFELTKEEYDSLRSQIVTLKKGRGQHSKFTPFVFTEQGIAMLSSVLNSDKAIEINISIMRIFVTMRHFALTYKELSEKIKEIEDRFPDIYQALNFLMDKNKLEENQKNRTKIGYK